MSERHFDHMEALLRVLPHERVPVPAGHCLFKAGQPMTALYLLTRGSISLQRVRSDGSVTTVLVCGPGMLLDETALFTTNHRCDAVATSPCELIRVSRQSAWQAILQGTGPFALQFLQCVAHSHQESLEQIELRGVRPLSARLLAWLQGQPRDEQGWTWVACPWTEVARMLAMSQEALYRTLSGLATEGVIERDSRRVRVRQGDGALT